MEEKMEEKVQESVQELATESQSSADNISDRESELLQEVMQKKERLQKAESKIAELEKVHGKWTPTKKGDGDAPYTVPNFGLDRDMLDASESISATQAQLGHTWEPTQDKNGVWQVPQPIDNRSYSYSG